jgi:AraC-like DNA-binding protein
METHATTLSSWARAIRNALDAAGTDSACLFAQAELDIAALADPQARYPVARTNRLWALAVEATGNPAFGLEAARHSGFTTFHALGYSLGASATLHDAFDRMTRYFRVITDAAELSCTRQQSIYRCQIGTRAGAPAPTDEAVDAICLVIVRMCRGLYRRQFGPLRLSLKRAAPADVGPYERAFGAQITFGAAINQLEFDAASFDLPLEGANPELARQNDEIAARYLARFEKSNLRARLHAVLIEQLPGGEPSQTKAAQVLNLSARSLQRKLADEGTSYKQMLEETRRDLALSYLRDPRYSMSEITYLLGFADTSSFTHAFRRWTGTAPSRYQTREGPIQSPSTPPQAS